MKQRYYKFLDDRQEWVIRDRTNRRNEYRVGRNKIYAENLVNLLNLLTKEINELKQENEDLIFTLRTVENNLSDKEYNKASELRD